MLTAIAEIAGSALDRALLLDTLEQRVEARTRDLAKANEQLQELDRLKTKFAFDVSHELRTPITNLSLYLKLLEKNPEKQARYLPVLRKQARRLGNLIEDTVTNVHNSLRGTAVSIKIPKKVTGLQKCSVKTLPLCYSATLQPLKGSSHELTTTLARTQ
ncbi:MAG: hypothetical protein GY803_06345 [Chloroflexi bacterium]|nr:hypothetical protein [Chloroflexota bacterium]